MNELDYRQKISCRSTACLPVDPIVRKSIRNGSVTNWGIATTCSVIAVLLLAYTALQLRENSDRYLPFEQTVRVYCAAGVVQPLESIIAAYHWQQVEHHRIELLRTGGSGELFGQIKTEYETAISVGAELFITADDELLSRAKQLGIVRECFPIAVQTPVIAVAATSELSIENLADLVNREDVRFGIASQGAAIGKMTRAIARRDGLLQQLEDSKATDSENVMILAQALITGSLDAAVVWDTTVSQINAVRETGQPILRIAALADSLDQHTSTIAVGVVASTRNPAECLQFARFLTASETGRQVFGEFGYSLAE